MQFDNRFLDDFARVTSGALGTLVGVKSEVEAIVRQQFERVLTNMDLVPREEFEAVKEMAAKARGEQDALAERVAALEARLAAPGPAKKRTPRKKTDEGGAPETGESGPHE